MALLFVGVLMGALDLAIIGPALPAIQAEFALDNRQLSWLFNVYVLAQLPGTPLLAKMSDRFGRRDVYIACVAAFAVGSLLLVVAGNFETLIVGRGIQGFGASGIFPVAAAVIGDTFPEEKRGGALGLIGAVFGLAFLIGPVLGGILLRYSWEWLFLINLPIAVGLIVAAWRLLPGGRATEPLPFDWTGGVLLTVTLIGFAFGVTNLDSADLSASLRSLNVWPYLLAGAVLLPVFWRREQRAADPILRPSFFRSRRMRLILTIAAGVGTVESAQVFLPALAVASLGVTESVAAWLMLPAVFIMIIVSPLVGKLVDRIGPAQIVQGSLVFVFVGILIFGIALMTFVSFIGGGIITGIGLAAMLGAPMRYIILEEARAEDRASAQGLLNIFLAIGQLTGAAIVGSVATSMGGGTVGYQSAYLVLAALSLLLIGVALGLKNKSPIQDD
ncbi:MAG: MFS transporter [Gammaproteobacteria bacterium]|nr:MFS transporter [Gammaproteobacteria bacterium]